MIHVLLAAAFTGPMLKVRVDGEGYLRFIRDGRAVYAKETALQICNGKLADSAGDPVLPSIEVGNATDLASDLEGNIFVTSRSQRVKVGQLVLAMFPPTEAFRTQDVVLVADDRPKLGNPGDDAFGVVRVIAGFDEPTTKVTIKPVMVETPKPRATINPNADPLTNQFQIKSQPPTPKPQMKLPNGVGLQITVQEHSVVEGEHVLLSDVAQIDGDPKLVAKASVIELEDTPPTGLRRFIDRSRVLGCLRLNGIQPEQVDLSVPETAEVRRKGQMIPNSQFVLTATQALIAQGGLSGTWQSTDSFADLEVPSGALDLKAEQMNGQDTGNATVVVAIYISGTRYNSRSVHLHLKDAVPPVQIGSAVKVILIAGAAQVEISGVARTQGRMGQTIQVEVQIGNPAVRTYHTGTVTGPGTVEVKL
jgi:hypothetical protein